MLKHRAKLFTGLRAPHRPFEDETFPPSSRSIFINGLSFSPSTMEFFSEQSLPVPDDPSPSFALGQQPVQWLRPDQIVSSSSHTENNRYQWTIFRDPKPNDVIQGALGLFSLSLSLSSTRFHLVSLGDCWFITALSVLAERPEYLTKVRNILLPPLPSLLPSRS